jgi:hypothetical protein
MPLWIPEDDLLRRGNFSTLNLRLSLVGPSYDPMEGHQAAVRQQIDEAIEIQIEDIVLEKAQPLTDQRGSNGAGIDSGSNHK